MRRIWITLVVAMLMIAGCRSGVDDEPSEAEGPEVGVPIDVVRDSRGSVLAFVDVYVGDDGPHVFAIDTGASRSVISPDLAESLNLESAGDAGEITGVTGTQQAQLVEMANWRIGDTDLPDKTIISVELPDIGGPSRLMEMLGFEALSDMQGLLGSDVLSEFGQIAIDYEQQVLRLRFDEPAAEQ